MSSTKLPPCFTLGAPTKEGCYVLIYRDGTASCGLSVNDVFSDADGLFVVMNPEDMECEPVEDFGIVAHMQLEGLSAHDLWHEPEKFGIYFLRPKGPAVTADEAKRMLEEVLRRKKDGR